LIPAPRPDPRALLIRPLLPSVGRGVALTLLTVFLGAGKNELKSLNAPPVFGRFVGGGSISPVESCAAAGVESIPGRWTWILRGLDGSTTFWKLGLLALADDAFCVVLLEEET